MRWKLIDLHIGSFNINASDVTKVYVGQCEISYHQAGKKSHDDGKYKCGRRMAVVTVGFCRVMCCFGRYMNKFFHYYHFGLRL